MMTCQNTLYALLRKKKFPVYLDNGVEQMLKSTFLLPNLGPQNS